MTIPIYRAKKIDSDKYEIGFLLNNMIVTAYEQEVKRDGIYWKSITTSKIDPTTLSIHFDNMLDSQGNKIFASLSEDGKGGDCTFMENGYNETFCWDRLNACVVLKSRNYECRCFRNGSRNETTFNTYKIIGTQE